jgi:hypothetical protein
MISEDGGATWIPTWGLHREEVGVVYSFDVFADEETLLVAYIRKEDGAMRLRLLRWAPGGSVQETELWRFVMSTPRGPGARFAYDGRMLHLIAGMRAESGAWQRLRGIFEPLPHDGDYGQYLYWRSQDRGRTWSHTEALPMGDTISLGDWGPIGWTGGYADGDAAIAASGKSVFVFATARGIVGYRAGQDGVWEGPVAIDDAWVPSDGRYGNNGRVIEAYATKDSVFVLWINERHQRIDDTPLEIMASLLEANVSPWINNDIYIAAGRTLDELASPAARRRITSDLSYARGLRATMMGDTLFCVWPGYSHVRRSTPKFDSERNLFFIAAPVGSVLEEAVSLEKMQNHQAKEGAE